jgi:tetratricopeptide (TPR) repeat protein
MLLPLVGQKISIFTASQSDYVTVAQRNGSGPVMFSISDDNDDLLKKEIKEMKWRIWKTNSGRPLSMVEAFLIAAILLLKLYTASGLFFPSTRETRIEALDRHRAAFAVDAAENPTNAYSQRRLAVVNSDLGDAHLRADHQAAAIQAYQEALAIVDQLVNNDENDALSQAHRYTYWQKIASAQLDEGDDDQALQSFRAAVSIAEALVERGVDRIDVYDGIPVLYATVAKAFPGQGWWAKTLDILKRIKDGGMLRPKYAKMMKEAEEKSLNDSNG